MTRLRVLFLSRGRIDLPLAPWLAAKWDALSDVFDVRALNAGSGRDDARFHILPERSWAFYPTLPFEVARELRARPADAVIASDPYVGAAALCGRSIVHSRAKVIVEVHGDPRTLTRLYGSSRRGLLAGFSDVVARDALRRADATRAVSTFTGRLIEEARGRPPTATFLAYSDLSAFADPPVLPVPDAPGIVFVGALEPYKNVERLAASWRRLAPTVPGARLTIVGSGSKRSVVDALVRDLPGQVEHYERLEPSAVAKAIDAARVLVLPSFPEGLGRVVLEAFARGRGVVATDGGGIPDIVTDGRDGLLVPPHDTDALTEALRRVLEEQELAVRLGAAGRQSYRAWHQTPAEFATSYHALVDSVLQGAR